MSLRCWQESALNRILFRHNIGRKIFGTIGPEYAVATVGPNRMYLDLRDRWGVSKFILRHGYYDNLVSILMKDWIGTEGNVIDVGANIGYHTLLAAHLTSGHVYAFEPEQRNFQLLKENIGLNEFKNITPFWKAAGDKNDTLKLYRSEINAGDHQLYRTSEAREFTEVSVVRIDDELRQVNRISYIKIDVQGFELNVVKGMENILRENHEIKISSEFWPAGLSRAGSSSEEYLRYMESLGFSWYLLDEEHQRVATIDRKELLNRCSGEHAVDLLFSRS